MEALRTIWLFLCRLCRYAFTLSTLNTQWSRLYRFLFEGKYVKTELHGYTTMREVAFLLQKHAHHYKPDGALQLGDAVSYPHKAQAVFDGKLPPPTDGFDCDDFAVFTANVLLLSINKGMMNPIEVSEPKFLSVIWMEGWAPNGHAVCLVRYKGNYAYMDYGFPRGEAPTIEGVVRNVMANNATGTPTDLIGWSLHLPDLSLVEVHWGAP